MRLDTNVEFGEGWFDTLGKMVANLRPESKALKLEPKLQLVYSNEDGIIYGISSQDAWAGRICIAEGW